MESFSSEPDSHDRGDRSARAEARKRAALGVAGGAGPKAGRCGWLAAVAGLGLAAGLLARGLSPALVGVWVGADGVISGVQLAAANLTQLFAIAALALVVGQVLATSAAALPPSFRVLSVGVVGLVAMAVVSGMFLDLPPASTVISGLSAALIALAAVRRGLRLAHCRMASLVLGAVAIAGLLRLCAVGAGYLIESHELAALAPVPGLVATVALLGELGAILLALGWLGRSPRRPELLVVAAVLVGAAAAIAYLSSRGGETGADNVVVLLHRVLEHLRTAPIPLVPAVVVHAVEALGWLVAAAVLLKRWSPPALPAAVALALLARGTLEAPLGAVALLLAALAVALATTLPPWELERRPKDSSQRSRAHSSRG